jgi:hypothetical protein
VSAPDLTYPHDYRLICAGQPPAVVVGGQAVNLWAIMSRAFKVLQNRRTAQTLAAEGIDRRSLIPEELADSPLSRIKDAFKWQAPSLDK